MSICELKDKSSPIWRVMWDDHINRLTINFRNGAPVTQDQLLSYMHEGECMPATFINHYVKPVPTQRLDFRDGVAKGRIAQVGDDDIKDLSPPIISYRLRTDRKVDFIDQESLECDFSKNFPSEVTFKTQLAHYQDDYDEAQAYSKHITSPLDILYTLHAHRPDILSAESMIEIMDGLNINPRNPGNLKVAPAGSRGV